jgi:hypothetical protein
LSHRGKRVASAGNRTGDIIARVTDTQLCAALARTIKGQVLGMSEGDDPLSVIALPVRATVTGILAFDKAERKRRGLEASRAINRADITLERGTAAADLLRSRARCYADELVLDLSPDAHPDNQAERGWTVRAERCSSSRCWRFSPRRPRRCAYMRVLA